MRVLAIIVIVSSITMFKANAQENLPDTVTVGVYLTSVHNIDFKEKEYYLTLWLWMKYKNPDFDFVKNLEIPMAKSFEKSYTTIDTLPDGTLYLLMKLQCIMKGTWRIKHFPFDRQKLRFAIENSKYDASELVFKADTVGKHFGNFFMMQWEKDSLTIKVEEKKYETAFGDPAYDKPEATYSVFRVILSLHRNATELFFKLFLGMYIAFLIGYTCFYIHADNIDSRLSLSVGSLFAVIGNKYIIESSLPESTSFTLVDTLHGITLFVILIVVASSVIALNLTKKGKIENAKKFDMYMAQFVLVAYIIANYFLISTAYNSQAQ